MKHTIYAQLEQKFRDSLKLLGYADDVSVGLVEASKPEFGDYQVNGIMALAKIKKTNPRELATKVIDNLDLKDIASEVSVAGPGFINIKLHNDFLSKYLDSLNQDNQFGVAYLGYQAVNVVVDLSSPNLAKEMHVGHLRSTVIGDSLARIFTYLNESDKTLHAKKVIRQNHVGDWGTQFGMLIAYLYELRALHNINVDQVEDNVLIKDLEDFYRKAKLRFDEDINFADTARKCVVLLQQSRLAKTKNITPTNSSESESNINSVVIGGKTVTADDIYQMWAIFRNVSLNHCQQVYDKLGIGSELSTNIKAGVVYGESDYEPDLPGIVDKLEKVNIKDSDGNTKSLVNYSEGAKCIFFEEGELPGGEVTPFIIQKKDGAYLYSTTDLAAICYRVNSLKAEQIIYVVDARQAFHFRQLFKVAEKANFDCLDFNSDNKPVKLMHSAFGTMMNEDGRPFKTRDGGTIKLIDLITEAEDRANRLLLKLNPDWSANQRMQLAIKLAIAAIKYSDLSKNRNSDYVFSFDKMLAFDGNTAPYLLYANTRISSIINKASEVDSLLELGNNKIIISEESEHRLGLHLSNFAQLLELAANECYPHYLCQYLYELSGLFMQFYESCQILKAPTDIKNSRLKLAILTQNILKTGLNLLGIETVSTM